MALSFCSLRHPGWLLSIGVVPYAERASPCSDEAAFLANARIGTADEANLRGASDERRVANFEWRDAGGEVRGGGPSIARSKRREVEERPADTVPAAVAGFLDKR